MAALLTPEDLRAGLAKLPGWSAEGNTIRRKVSAPDFPTAIALVVAVAGEAEAMNHHPDIDIRWRDVHFALSTHSAGGLTPLDLDLAQRIDDAAAARGAG
jgi:4a-hydroxytetrahydrobiopterin dehydratase